MYISQLVINGFKTFNSKTTLEFGDGITSVVGPNGCGKTNIVDAIRWVLGEQKHSTLRSARMEDVIFNGAKGTKPLSMCEVYLTVKNDKGKLPVEYTDVEIGRRLYRDGESEYFINKNACRLKDINNLFIDTGMGADSYSVIELKMIEQILSETDDGRKFLFEEAAGINKYKNQKRLSIKKFEATKFDLERINDIISEVEAKVKGLNLQLKRFKRHATLVDKLKQHEIDLGTLRINKYLELSDPLREKIAEFSHLRETKVSDQGIQEDRLDKLKKSYSEQETEIQSLRKAIEELTSKREKSNQLILISKEQNRSSEKDIVRLNQETENNNSRIKKFEQSIKDIETEVSTLTPQIDDKLSHFKNEQNKFEKLELAYKKDQSEVDKIQSDRWELQKDITSNRSLAVSTETSIKERGVQKDKLEQRIKSENIQLDKLSKDKKELAIGIDSFDSIIDDLENKKTKLASHLEQIEIEIADLSNKKQSNDLLIDTLSNQLEFYKELIESQSDLPSGVKHLIEDDIFKKNKLKIVSDIFSTDEKYEKAINVALGELSHSVISQDRETAINILDNVRSSKAGRISVIPLSEIGAKRKTQRSVPNSKHIIDWASSLIKCETMYSNLAELLAGDILIVDDIKAAIADKELIDWTLIDVNGVMYNSHVLSNPRSSKGTTIGRNEKIKSLQSQIEKLSKTNTEIGDGINKAQDNKNSINDEISNIVDSIKSEKQNAETKNLEFQRLQFDIENKKQIISDAKSELKETDSSVNELKQSILALNKRVIVDEKALSGIQKKLDDANERLEISRKERDDHHQAMQDIRIELLNFENKRDNLNQQRKTAENTISELNDRQNKIVSEIAGIKDQIESRISEIEENEKSLVLLNKDISDNQKEIYSKEESFRKTYQAIEEIETRIKSEQKSRESILEELKHCEVQIAEYNQSIKAIKENIKDKYSVKVPHSEEIGLSEEEIEQDISKIERSLEIIGPVNMAVQDEFEQEQSRLGHLIEQRDDLIESEENLRESIDKIDRIARKQFRETFDQIKTNFENLFTIFFEGGQGTLELIGDPDPLEAEIAIRAQPPGKRNQTLRMLSAGEKSLTAIALLFAIYQFKPSPYCILDEVDAPLDDSNVKKFTRGLKSFTTDTQFIIVTHNKLTMEAANYLYGVTMEKKGISKLVSVKFD